MSTLRSLAHQQDGQALVEFALVLPLLAIFLFGMLDFGKAYNYWNDATHLSAEAARYAAVNSAPNPASAVSLQAQIQGQADTGELRNGATASVPSAATVCIDFPNGTSNPGDPVRVRMTFTYTWVPLIGTQLSSLSTTISSSSVMRLEAPPTTYSAGCA
ncbi:TadE family protein [Baekduia sp.]|uniref:TadE/TadG family type IV pilus assembly protein n=1 Tax=Baekduia sp. TaxID=2600305 RepID=UPI002D1FBA6A|nr:TadE family protein [Baekduia sp.]